MKSFITITLVVCLSWSFSCSGRKGDKIVESALVTIPAADTLRLIKMTSPKENEVHKINNSIEVQLDIAGKNRNPDSVIVYFNGSVATTLRSAPWKFTIPSSHVNSTGKKSVKATAWKDAKSQSVTRFVILHSDTPALTSSYKVRNVFPHNRDAFTQGLFYSNGLFYEGTGQEAVSSLREVEPETGKVLRQQNLESSLFGEGITLLNDQIFQVTWENKVGFVYEKSTFKLIRKIYYPTQGWGLTTVGDKIVMSDGTNILYFNEPEMFTTVSRLEVYDDKGKVDSLNELEYINGEIWANIWMKDLIARIDPGSGKVIAYIDLKGLLPEADRSPGTDVLNGIAYDSEGKRIFVTGKNWPKLFEITVVR
jgi:glutaminyl-peptide cyclotransferase